MRKHDNLHQSQNCTSWPFNPFVPDLIECPNNKDPDQPQPSAVSDRDLRCLLLSQDAKHHCPSSRHHRVGQSYSKLTKPVHRQIETRTA